MYSFRYSNVQFRFFGQSASKLPLQNEINSKLYKSSELITLKKRKNLLSNGKMLKSMDTEAKNRCTGV
jgi:hypothetical protein